MVTENNTALWRQFLPKCEADTHKYHRGYVLVNGGGITSTGAARLAASAALRIGAGLVSVITDKEALPVYAASLAAVMTKCAASEKEYNTLIHDEKLSALLLGPGNGVSDQTHDRVLAALKTQKPILLDADALTCFEHDTETLFSMLHQQAVLTPHEGEFARLFGKVAKDDASRMEAAKKAAKCSGAIVVLKGKNTVIATAQGKLVMNKHAPAYLATAGSGDVLAGMIAGLMAGGMPAFDAACAAVWMHGEAGYLFGKGLIAEDLLTLIPRILQSLE